jgi:polyhydroxyalkanoate synthesis repressor PhaR
MKRGQAVNEAKSSGGAPIVIKKYANRRLYNTATSTYVTLEDLSHMVREGIDFTVCDAKTGEDITRTVLTQIIFEEEGKGTTLLESFGAAPFQMMEDMTKRNVAMFQQAMTAFNPFALAGEAARRGHPNAEPAPASGNAKPGEGTSQADLDSLRKQVMAMQNRLEELAGNKRQG